MTFKLDSASARPTHLTITRSTHRHDSREARVEPSLHGRGRALALAGVFALLPACNDPPAGTGASSSDSTGAALTTTSGTSVEPTGSTSGGGSCGNGVVDPTESCDIAIPAGEPGSCPASCEDGVNCTSDALKDAGTCNAVCTFEVIEVCQSGDSCCPGACDAGADSDCSQTCGDGVLDPGEQCDTAIGLDMPGNCAIDCNDGVACTQDILLNPGTCGAECLSMETQVCDDGDGCCPAGCEDDTDCSSLARIKQSVITENGQEAWARNGYWDGMKYDNWTAWTGQGLTMLVPDLGNGQAYRGIDHVVLADERVKVTALQLDGKTAWVRYGTWDGSAYSSWTAWSNQFGDLTAVVPGEPMPQAYRSFDHVVLPDGRIKQTLLTFDGKKIWYRYATWDGKMYGNWTQWSAEFGDLTQLIPGKGMTQSFRSYNHFVFVDQRMKVQVLSEDGKTAWHRYAEWDGAKYINWTEWTDQWGDLTKLLPGKGSDQSFLALDEGALAGMGVSSGCQNGCNDDDPCTVDTCVGSSCQHALLSCNDSDPCTDDVCVNGGCQNLAKDCNDGDACTNDSCTNGVCMHGGVDCNDGNPCTNDSCSGGCQHADNGMCQGGNNCGNCDDGNPCTDDWCDGVCKHSNNSASCGNGGKCENGSCKTQDCVCTTGCKDSCGNPCNYGKFCAYEAFCNAQGDCQCIIEFCPDAGQCCTAGQYCGLGGCCDNKTWTCQGGACGYKTNNCGFEYYCGGCPKGQKCGGNNACVPI